MEKKRIEILAKIEQWKITTGEITLFGGPSLPTIRRFKNTGNNITYLTQSTIEQVVDKIITKRKS